MTFSFPINIALVGTALSLSAMAASSPESITTAQIAAAIRSAGTNVSAGQIVLLSNVVSKSGEPILRVESVGAWEGNVARVRMDCGRDDECLPFVVTVRRDPHAQKNQTAVPADPAATGRTLPATSNSAIVVRRGTAAILLLDGGRVHIQLAVVCLENGAVGQTIRVASKGYEHTYQAEVCSDGLLRGTL